jgi:hypothetical protein
VYEQLPINRLEARTREKREEGESAREREKIEATNKINAFDWIHEQTDADAYGVKDLLSRMAMRRMGAHLTPDLARSVRC